MLPSLSPRECCPLLWGLDHTMPSALRSIPLTLVLKVGWGRGTKPVETLGPQIWVLLLLAAFHWKIWAKEQTKDWLKASVLS